MKIKRIITLAIAVVMTMALIPSCVSEQEETKTSVTLKIVAGDDTLYDNIVVVTGESPKILDVLNTAIAVDEVDITYAENGYSIQKIGYYYETSILGTDYFWDYYVNGKTPQKGNAENIVVANGDVIEYYFNTMVQVGEEKYEYKPYDSSLNYFGPDAVLPEDTTEE